MKEAPNLMTLCIESIKNHLLHGDEDDSLSNIYELPSDLLDCLVPKLSPLSLHRLQQHLISSSRSDPEFNDNCYTSGRKRKRYGDFDAAWRAAWRAAYMSRWPQSKRSAATVLQWVEDEQKCEQLTKDWQQSYWETHIQDCMDEAAERALLPSFDGCVGRIKISDDILRFMGYNMSHLAGDHLYLSYHCQEFGFYARSLRLRSVLCTPEMSHLLRSSQLHSLVLRRIRTQEHVDGLCKLLNQNVESLRSLKFFDCDLSSSHVNVICDSLHTRESQSHFIQDFSVQASRFLESTTCLLPMKLASFLSSGRSLDSLTLCDIRLGSSLAEHIVDILFNSSSRLSILDLSENHISGCFTYFKHSVPDSHPSAIGISMPLQSLRVLKLRGNNLQPGDAADLKEALVSIPNLETLDISDNPIEDDGIRSLIPYFVGSSARNSQLANVMVENCELTSEGVSCLLDVISSFTKPLCFLSIADNDLGSKIAAPLAKIFSTSVKVLNVEFIGLGSSGFFELERNIRGQVKLVELNLSKNRGGIATAKFLLKLIPLAPELLKINASHNFMPADSLVDLCSILKKTEGKLKHLDLRGNTRSNDPFHVSIVNDFQQKGRRPTVLFPSRFAPPPDVPYDDDV